MAVPAPMSLVSPSDVLELAIASYQLFCELRTLIPLVWFSKTGMAMAIAAVVAVVSPTALKDSSDSDGSDWTL